jgi:predicted ATP-dependent endonuclease of OLD family
MTIIKAFKEYLEKPKNDNQYVPQDIIVKRVSYVTEYDEEGNEIKKRKEKLVNITKKINETKKLIKTNTAEEKLAAFDKICTITGGKK